MVIAGASATTLVAPASTRDNTSRPSQSVPSGCVPPGRPNACAGSTSSGPYGASSDQVTATTTQARTTAALATKAGRRSRYRTTPALATGTADRGARTSVAGRGSD